MSAVPALAAGPQHVIRRTTGTTRQVRVRMVSQPWSATATMAPRPVKGARQPQFIGHYPGYAAAKRQANERLKKLLQSTARKKPLAAATVAAASSAMVVFDGPNETDTPYIPPDPQVAAGPSDVVVAINTLLAIYDKTGAQQGGFQNLSTFFSSLNVTGQLTDPRIIYDQADKRFILSIADIDFKNFTGGHVLLAVSATSDPTGVWNKYAIDFMGRNVANTADTFPDFPGLGLGPTAVYLTSNQFALDSQCLSSNSCKFSDAWIKVIDLPALLSGSSSLTITTFKTVQSAGGSLAFDIQPALSYGTPNAEFLVAAEFSVNPGTSLNLFSITTSGTPTLASADLTVPPFSIPPNALQPAGSWIDTNDFRVLNAVWSNGSLWCGQNVNGSNLNVAARWYQIALTDLASASLTQSGDVNGAAAAYYPALGVGSGGAAVMSFSTSSGIVPASAAYTGRQPSDAADSMRSYAIVKEGLGPYDETIGNRWGDYNGISLDPGGASLWTIAEYAGAPDPEFGTEIAQINGDPSLSITPGEADFGSILVGRTSAPQTFTVTNVSGNSVTLGTANVGGANAADFTLSADQCSGVALAAGQTCTISVTFTPTFSNYETAQLSLGDQDGMLVAGMIGRGYYEAILTASPSTLNFPDTVEQSASAPMTITLTDTGNLTSQISSISPFGPFTATNNCGASLAPGASCQVTVTFYPTMSGTLQGNLNVSSNGVPPTITLTGTGIPAPAAVPCPTALSFGNQKQGTTSAPKTVILTNTGSSLLTVSKITPSGDFAETDNCLAGLNPRTSCTISVTFTPTTTSTESGTLTITDDAAGSPQIVSLTGAGASVTAPASRSRARTSRDRSPANHATASAAKARRRLARAERPLDFEPNVGQFRRPLRFVARIPGYALGVEGTGMLLESSTPLQPRARKLTGRTRSSRFVRMEMRLDGANPNARISGVDRLPGKASYFFGADSRRWHTNVPTYARVSLTDIYPGINLVYYGNQRNLEYDFVVRPGANPRRIRLRFAGASGLRVGRAGDLLVKTGAGVARLRKPVVYQTLGGVPPGEKRVNRRGEWHVVGGRTAEFRLGGYDRSRVLVIDPVLSFSSYLGASGAGTANAIALDAQGSVYLAGETSASDFPVSGSAFQKTCAQVACQGIGFVAKLTADGSTLLYATYLGGTQHSQINALAIDSTGDAYLTGYTNATDFPTTTGAFQTVCIPSDPTASYCAAPFVTKLDPSGSSLVYSTYLGEGAAYSSGAFGQSTEGYGIALDSAGDAYVGGGTTIPDFPTTTGAFEAQDPMTEYEHGFLSELNPAGSALVFSTYLGGTGSDQVSAVTIDGSQSVYVTGTTESLDFPTSPGAFQRGLYGSVSGNQNAFVAKFSSSGSLIYSTLLGGTGQGGGQAIAVDSNGAAYVTGDSNYGDFPVTPGAFETTSDSGPAFVAKLHPDACALEYGTYLGPQQSGWTTLRPSAIAVGGSGDVYVAGRLFENSVPPSSPTPEYMPTKNPLQPAMEENNGFAGELNPTGSALLFSTPLGGSFSTQVNAMALDSQGNIYVAGNTLDPDLPVVNALESTCTVCQQPALTFGQGVPFLAKISPAAANGVTLTRSSLTFGPLPVQTSSPVVQSVGLMNNQSVALNIQSVTVNGAGYTLPTSPNPCSGSIAPGAGCIVTVQFNPTATGSQTGTVTITDDGPGSPRQIALTGTGLADFTFDIQGPQPNPLVAGTDSATYSVLVTGVPGATLPTGDVSLSCTNVDPATCTLDPTSLSTGSNQGSTLTVGNLSAIGTKPLSFDVTGTLSGQTASVPEQISLMDFSLSASSTSATINAGQQAGYQIAVAPINGFNQTITFSCSGLPTDSFCEFAPALFSLDGQTTSKLTVNIATTARSVTPPPGSPGSWPGTRPLPLGLWALALAILLVLTFLSAELRRRKVWLPVLLALALATTVSCGGGGGAGSSGGSGGTVTGTPAGTYTVTVTGTNGPDSHTVKLKLTVQ